MPFSYRFCNALTYAAVLHRDQTRKSSGVPYIGHLLNVAGTVIDYGGDEDEAIAALMHDGPEDQGGATIRKAIAEQFGERVAEIVDGCTDTDQKPKPPWKERKEKHIAHLKTLYAPHIIVIAADKLHNLRMLASDYQTKGEKVWEIFNGKKEGTLWYYRAMYEGLRTRFNELGQMTVSDFNKHLALERLLDELNRTLVNLERQVPA